MARQHVTRRSGLEGVAISQLPARAGFWPAKLSRGATIESFIANTRGYQAEGIQLAAESYRRQRYQPVAALFQFMFSETWPSINWAVIDYQRHPKAGYFALQRAYQPVLPSIEPLTLNWRPGESGKVGLWAINDRWQDYTAATLRWRVTQGEQELARGEMALDLPADSGRKLKELKLTPRTAQPLQVVTELTDSNGLRLVRIAGNFRWASHKRCRATVFAAAVRGCRLTRRASPTSPPVKNRSPARRHIDIESGSGAILGLPRPPPRLHS